MDGGSTFSLQLRYTYWLEMVVIGLIVFQRAYSLQNVGNSISMYK